MLQQCEQDFVGKGRDQRGIGQMFEGARELSMVEFPESGNKELIFGREVGSSREIGICTR